MRTESSRAVSDKIMFHQQQPRTVGMRYSIHRARIGMIDISNTDRNCMDQYTYELRSWLQYYSYEYYRKLDVRQTASKLNCSNSHSLYVQYGGKFGKHAVSSMRNWVQYNRLAHRSSSKNQAGMQVARLIGSGVHAKVWQAEPASAWATHPEQQQRPTRYAATPKCPVSSITSYFTHPPSLWYPSTWQYQTKFGLI